MTEEAAPERALTEEEQRVRSYLVSQAEKYDWIALWPRAMAERSGLLGVLDGVSDEQTDWSPSGDEWTIRQITEHVLNASRRSLRLIEDLAAGREEDDRVDPPTTKLPTRFERLRMHLSEHSVKLASLPERLPPMVNLEMTSPHSNFGDLNSRAWFLFNRIHDADHRQQVEAIQAAPGYPSA